MVGMAARVDIASAAANSAQKITTTKVQIVGSTGSTATKEPPCTKNRKSNHPTHTVSWLHIWPPGFLSFVFLSDFCVLGFFKDVLIEIKLA